MFDHLGGQSLRDSWHLLARGGTLVSYGLASLRDAKGSMLGAFLPHLGRIYLWKALPNGRHAYFYNLWSGKILRPRASQRKLNAALTEVFALLANGRIHAQVARRMPLEQAAEAMRLAESGTIVGKVVLIPGMA